MDRRAVLPDRGDAGPARARPRPRAAGADRAGHPLAGGTAREPARARPAHCHGSRGRFARPDPDGTRAARAGARRQGARALAHHRPAAGDRRAAAGPPAQPRAEGNWRGRADLARGHAGADFHWPHRRGGLLLAILVLPLTIPVLIFGVAASNAAIVGPIPFGTPFSILCALTLASVVIGPLSAAIGLRQGLE